MLPTRKKSVNDKENVKARENIAVMLDLENHDNPTPAPIVISTKKKSCQNFKKKKISSAYYSSIDTN